MMKCQWKEKLTKFKCWHLWTTYCFVEEVYLRHIKLHKFKELQYKFMLQNCCNLQHQLTVNCVMYKYEEFSASRDANCFALIHCKNIIKCLLYLAKTSSFFCTGASHRCHEWLQWWITQGSDISLYLQDAETNKTSCMYYTLWNTILFCDV